MGIKLIGNLLPAVLIVLATSATAIDTREVIIGPQESLVTVPPHLGQVLATPNRNYAESIPHQLLDGSQKWEVYAPATEAVQWRDMSYLKGKDVIRVEKAYFDFDVAQPIDVTALEMVLNQYPTQEGYTFLVVGHADEAGSYAYNQRLSEHRAQSIKDVLVSRGYNESSIQTLGKGKTIPVSFKDQSMNRRAEIVVKAPEHVLQAKQSIRPRGNAGQSVTPTQPYGNAAGAVTTTNSYVANPNPNEAQLLPSTEPRQPVMRAPTEAPTTATQKALLPSLSGENRNDLDGLFKRSPDHNN